MEDKEIDKVEKGMDRVNKDKEAGSQAESQKPRQRVSNADRKVFANPESFCDLFIMD